MSTFDEKHPRTADGRFTDKHAEEVPGGTSTLSPWNADRPVGTELRSPHGTRWVKTSDDEWRARGEWGVLDMASVYSDAEVYGEVVETSTATSEMPRADDLSVAEQVSADAAPVESKFVEPVKCRRCDGQGFKDWRVQFGRCFRCDGLGVVEGDKATIIARKERVELHKRLASAAMRCSWSAKVGLDHLEMYEPERYEKALASFKAGRPDLLDALDAYGRGLIREELAQARERQANRDRNTKGN